MEGITVIFDFDKTIIDCDSDNWVVDEMGLTKLFDQLLTTMPWNSAMDVMMKEIHAQGRTMEEIEECLKRAPLHPQTISAVKSAHALGYSFLNPYMIIPQMCTNNMYRIASSLDIPFKLFFDLIRCELKIVSDANLFFIQTILKYHGLIEYFSEINTNPGFVDEEGKLRILPFHDFDNSPHGCNLCPPNMCKGHIICRIVSTDCADRKKRFVYIGDGSGDFCPSLRLQKDDFVMPRKNFPLWTLICKNSSLVRAEVHEWSTPEEMEKVLLCLIQKVKVAMEEESDDSNELLSSDCNLERIPITTHESLLNPLSQM